MKLQFPASHCSASHSAPEVLANPILPAKVRSPRSDQSTLLVTPLLLACPVGRDRVKHTGRIQSGKEASRTPWTWRLCANAWAEPIRQSSNPGEELPDTFAIISPRNALTLLKTG